MFLPGLELFSAKGVSDVLNRIAKAMSVIVGGVNTPTITSSVMGDIFDSKNKRKKS